MNARRLHLLAILVLAGIALGGPLRADTRQDLESKLRSKYQNHIVTLRNFYLGEKLNFDSDGKLIGTAELDSWTVASQMQVEKMRVLNDGVEFRGKRVFLSAGSNNHFRSLFPVGTGWNGPDAWLFEDTKEKNKSKQLAKLRDLTIHLRLEPGMINEGSVRELIAKVILAPSEKLSSVVAPFWKGYLSTMENGKLVAVDALNNASQGEKKNFKVGGGVSAPHPLQAPNPEYSEWARRAQLQGTLVLGLIVDRNGEARDVKILKPLGLGLDEKSVQVVSGWRFEPAMKDKQPVDVQIAVQVEFRLY